MKPVLQLEKTGCGIACVATLAGVSYSKAKTEARALGVVASDPELWSGTRHILTLLSRFKIKTTGKQQRFSSWEQLPDCALLAIKWHKEKDIPHWHWTIFIRDSSGIAVLDPKKELSQNRRTDFGRIRPKWFIEVVVCKK